MQRCRADAALDLAVELDPNVELEGDVDVDSIVDLDVAARPEILVENRHVGSRSTMGSRLLVWLHAVRSALAVRGYDAGTVVCFSSRLPRMRWSSGSRVRKPVPPGYLRYMVLAGSSE